MSSGELTAASAEAEAFLKSVSHRDRLAILCALQNGEQSVNELADRLKFSQATLSQHLGRLRLDKLVQTRREGKRVFYCLSDSRIETLIAALHACFCTRDPEPRQDERN